MNALSSEEVVAKVKQIIAEVLKVNEAGITPQSKIVEDLGADSLDKVSLLMMLEDQFGKQISDDDAKLLVTVDDVLTLINRLQAAA